MENSKERVELAAEALRGAGSSITRCMTAGLALAVVFDEDLPPYLRREFREVKARIISLRGDEKKLAAELDDLAGALDIQAATDRRCEESVDPRTGWLSLTAPRR